VVQSLEDLLHLPPPAISQTPFYAHLLSSLPSLRLSIKDAVTASAKSWLFDVRESGAKVGELALEQMSNRIKKWRARREKEGGVRLARVGGALELVNDERVECESQIRKHFIQDEQSINLIPTVDALDNEHIQIDFRPLYQCCSAITRRTVRRVITSSDRHRHMLTSIPDAIYFDPFLPPYNYT